MKDGWRAAGIAAIGLAASAGVAAWLAFATPAEAPRDGRAWVLAARASMQANRYRDAAGAYEKGIAASRKVAADPMVWCELADALGMAQGGRLQGRPAELVGKALALDPAHPRALEMAGSAAYEAGDYGRALVHWEQLLAQVPPGSGAHADLTAAIARTRALL